MPHRLQAVLDGEPQPDIEAWETLNDRVFEERRNLSWPDVLDDAERSYRAQTACIQRLTDEELLAFDRCDWLSDGWPLVTVIMGSSYAQLHLAQYHHERGDVEGARRVVERCAARVIEADTPDVLRGLVLYNLACFQATHDDLKRARETLERALALYPRSYLREFARTDPDLAALRIPTT